MSRLFVGGCLLGLALSSCRKPSGTGPPPEGWANAAPTVVSQALDREEVQLLEVKQGTLTTWVQVPKVGAKAGDYILLGQGTARQDVDVAELDRTVKQIVDIRHARVVDFETAKAAVFAQAPDDAVPIGTVYAELARRANKDIVVYGTVVKASSAIGSYWIHLRDGTGDASDGTHDLTVRTQQSVTEGRRVAFRGRLRKDVDLGFGYHYRALVEAGELVR